MTGRVNLEQLAKSFQQLAATVEHENANLQREVNKIASQLDDALDMVAELRSEVAKRDQMIAELQAMNIRARVDL